VLLLLQGEYRILEELGRGAFGCVHRAQHSPTGRHVCIKTVEAAAGQAAAALEQQKREVAVLACLQHPNIIRWAVRSNKLDACQLLWDADCFICNCCCRCAVEVHRALSSCSGTQPSHPCSAPCGHPTHSEVLLLTKSMLHMTSAGTMTALPMVQS
jgi:hypothetical protein